MRNSYFGSHFYCRSLLCLLHSISSNVSRVSTLRARARAHQQFAILPSGLRVNPNSLSTNFCLRTFGGRTRWLDSYSPSKMPGTLQANASPSFTPNTSPSPGPRQQSLALSNRTPACTPSRNNSSSTAQSSLPPVFSPNQFTRHQSHQALPYELSLPQFQASAFQQPAAQQFYYALPTFDTNSTHLLSNIASSVINMAHPANSAFNVPNWYYIPNHDQPAQPAQPAPIVPIAPAQQAQPGPIIPIAPAPPAQSARPSQAIPPIQHAPAIQGVSVCYAPIPPAATVVPARPVGQVWAPHLAVHQVAPQVAAPQVPQVINGSTVAPVSRPDVKELHTNYAFGFCYPLLGFVVCVLDQLANLRIGQWHTSSCSAGRSNSGHRPSAGHPASRGPHSASWSSSDCHPAAPRAAGPGPGRVRLLPGAPGCSGAGSDDPVHDGSVDCRSPGCRR